MSNATLDRLKRLGFDQSKLYPSRLGGGARVGCSQCEAAVVNGVACHEQGCPNQTHECRECGEPIKRSLRLCSHCWALEQDIDGADFRED